MLRAFAEHHGVDPREEFLEVRLDHLRVLRLSENFQQVVVADEVKPRQHRPLLLEVLRQRLLTQIELRGHLREVLGAHARLRKRLHQRLALDGGHDPLEVLVHPPEPRLFLRQGASREDGLQVQPLPLDRVHVRQPVGECGQQLFPHLGFLLERTEERRVFQRRHQVLVIRHLREQVFPLLDQRHGASATAGHRVRDQRETSIETPNLQLVQSLAERDFALRLRVQRLELVHLVDEQIRLVQEVLQRQVLARHRLRAFRGELQQRKQLRPVRAFPALAATEFQRRHCLFVLLDRLEKQHRDAVLLFVRARAIAPLGEEVVQLVQLPANGDPVPGREVLLLHEEIPESAPRLARLFDIRRDLVQHGKLGPFHGKVLAVLPNLVALVPDLLQRSEIILQLADDQRGVALRHTLGLEFQPPVPKRLSLGVELGDLVHDLDLQVFLLRLEVRLELAEFRAEVLPLGIEGGEVDGRGCLRVGSPGLP